MSEPAPQSSAPESQPAGISPAPATPSAPVVKAPAAPETKPLGFTPSPAAPVATAAKLPGAPRFVSPMPKIEEVDEEVPVLLTIIAGVAAVATLAFAVLLYLKR